jgi:hypothetical protein
MKRENNAQPPARAIRRQLALMASPDISHYDFSDATSTALDRLAG